MQRQIRPVEKIKEGMVINERGEERGGGGEAMRTFPILLMLQSLEKERDNEKDPPLY